MSNTQSVMCSKLLFAILCISSTTISLYMLLEGCLRYPRVFLEREVKIGQYYNYTQNSILMKRAKLRNNFAH